MVPAGTASSKIIQARAYGSTVIVVEGSFDKEVARLYKAALQEFGWYDCLSSNPYRDEGKKSYAYEMADQLDGEIPDWVIHPTAGGTGIFAMWKGYREILSLGWIDRAPRLVVAQSDAAAPIVAALERGSIDVEPVLARDTVAESIQVGNPAALGWRALAAVRESRGTAAAVSDDEILRAQHATARLAGRETDVVVCNLTGHGLKQPEAVELPQNELVPIAPTLHALREQLRRDGISG
jgi:threonine synthase